MVFVCSESQGQSCPVVPYKVDKIYWDIEDPSTLTGTGKGLAKKIDKIRDEIKLKALDLIRNMSNNKNLLTSYWPILVCVTVIVKIGPRIPIEVQLYFPAPSEVA